MKSIVYILSAAVFLFPVSLLSDVVSTNDGIILNGTIIKENDAEIQFQSSVGVFTIKKENVSKLIRIQSEEESLKKFKKMKEETRKEKEKSERKRKQEEVKIEKQQQKEKEKAEKQQNKEKTEKQRVTEKEKPLLFNQYYAGMRHLAVQGEMLKFFSYGYNEYIGTTLNLRSYFWNSDGSFFPDMNVALEGSRFKNIPNSLKMYGISGGPVWSQTMRSNHLNIIFSETIWFSAVSAEIKTYFDDRKISEMYIFWQAAGIEPGYYMLHSCNNAEDFISLYFLSRELNLNPYYFAVQSCSRKRTFTKGAVHPEISGGLQFGRITVSLTAGFYYIPDRSVALKAFSAGFRLGLLF